MQWLNKIVDEAIAAYPEGELIVSSGVSPSGTYHLGTLREVLTAEAIMRELKRRGRSARHLHIVDDLDVFRKVPADVPEDFKKYLGKPLCDVPAPDGSDRSYADYFFDDLANSASKLNLEMEVVRSHEKYRAGFFTSAIEQTLENITEVRKILEDISGRQLDENWSPIQVIEEGYLKNRPFVALNKDAQTLYYQDKDNQEQTVSYKGGEVKLNWRIDWPARWSLMNVAIEPFGRDHATKGSSYDTGVAIVRQIFKAEPPLPVPYNFINRTGDTKKMSKSAGDTITAAELLQILPAEIIWFFILRYSPDKLLFFDEGDTLVRLFDEFAQLLVNPDKTPEEQQLLDICLEGVKDQTLSNIPFSHLVASYQASLKDAARTVEIIGRTEHASMAEEQADIIKKELTYIDNWLKNWAPDEVKFELREAVDKHEFSEVEIQFLAKLADKIASAPSDADGEWFHKAIYDFKDELGLEPKELFAALYKALIDKTSGPRAGWFLSILPRDWLIPRLQLKG